MDVPLDLSLPKRAAVNVDKSNLTRNMLEILKIQQLKVKREKNLQKARNFKNILVCEICKKLFDRKSLLIRHLRSHTGGFLVHLSDLTANLLNT